MAVSEQQLANWARGPGATEQERCDTTVRRITEALRPFFGSRVNIFAQGSYQNRTNVRQDSDVDVAVVESSTYVGDTSRMGPAALAQWNALSRASYTFAQLKSDVHQQLVAVFGPRVERRNKCIFVPETATGVDGDVVPAFEYRVFDYNGYRTASGIAFYADGGGLFTSFPQQHYDNGVAKNDRTQRMYKRAVRILKNVRNTLVENGQLGDKMAPSFFLECLAYNAADSVFPARTYTQSIKQVIEDLWAATEPTRASSLLEVNEIKTLFANGHTAEEARTFLRAAYSFIGF
jgi:hypothetical protein